MRAKAFRHEVLTLPALERLVGEYASRQALDPRRTLRRLYASERLDLGDGTSVVKDGQWLRLWPVAKDGAA